jgi:hypothetical protein
LSLPHNGSEPYFDIIQGKSIDLEKFWSFCMARYNGFFAIALPIEELRQLLLDLLESCNLEIMYETPSSIFAREFVGSVPKSKLVTVELIFETATSTPDKTRVRLEATNGELPLQTKNHCRELFDALTEVIVENYNWDTIESIAL